MNSSKIFLIDGYSFLFRAYHSMPPLTSPDKIPVGAIHGFTSMLLKLIDDFKPSFAAIIFDSGQKNFRHELYSEYKSHRPPPPEDLIPQFEIARFAANALGFVTIEKVGYEADDIIATIAKKLNDEIVIISSDKDLMQLVSDRVYIYDTMKNKYIKGQEVFEKFGVTPDKVIDALAIIGDTSDNIPGIPGIGPKGAAELIHQFGSLQNILENAHQIQQKARKQSIIDNKEIALLSKELVTLHDNIALEISKDDLALHKPNQNDLFNFCDLYGFKSLKTKTEKLFNFDKNISKNSPDNNISSDPFIKFVDENSEFDENPAIKKLTLDLKSLIKKYPDKNFDSFEDLSLMHYAASAGSRETLDISQNKPELYKALLSNLFQNKAFEIYYEYDLPFAQVLAEMESAGIRVDAKILQDLSNEFGIELENLSKEIYALSGEEFNIASPKQLSGILFQKLKIPKSSKSASTNAEVLEDLSANGFIIADFILKWRQISKLKNTYTDTLPKQINPETGRIHSNFSQNSTSTSRLSSSNPNLQNIPIRSEYGAKIRSSFIPESGCKLISADYSQIELRLLAHIANIEPLIEAFKNKQDIHARTALQIFGKSDSEFRRLAKAINFGIIYGISPFGLAKQLKIPQKEAANYIEKYFALYPGIKEYMASTIDFARKNEYVTNLFGRKSFMPDINSKNWALRAFSERAAINAPLQSSSADITKIAMNKLSKYLKENKYKTRMILQIHDEILFESPDEEVNIIMPQIQKIMQDVVELQSLLLVDIKAEDCWM